MDPLKQFVTQLREKLVILLLAENALVIMVWIVCLELLKLSVVVALIVSVVVAISLALIIAARFSWMASKPLRMLRLAVLHMMPNQQSVQVPQLESVEIGRGLVGNILSQIYEIANVSAATKADQAKKPQNKPSFVATNLPLPLFIINKDSLVVFANHSAADYLGLELQTIIGQNIYSVLDMSFSSENTFDSWLARVRSNAAVATETWERVRLNLRDSSVKQLDLAAYYNQNNAENIETMLVLFDHTESYNQDDQAMSFVALGVHELRTPLTLLRGYIEVFEEELSDNFTPELKDFMYKMNASAQQLTAFVSNILNVARVDNDQLELQLKEEDWSSIIRTTADNLALRAKVRGITLEYSIAPNLPTVGVDRVSIYEVMNNLVDNAIKYSGKSTRIRISTYLNSEDRVETSVQDFGVGIPTNVMPNLFSKFYRNHRNRAQIGGTGLGLYLSKAIIAAHGGNIWVNSKEGEGSTFSFTLIPYSQLAAEIKNNDNKDIVRGAHGWIKNHSLYRR